MENLHNENIPTIADKTNNMPKRRIIAFLLFFSTFIILAFLYKYDYLSFLSNDSGKSIGIVFKDKEYGVNFIQKYKNLSYDLADFLSDENWDGDGYFSDAAIFDQYSGMSLRTRNGKTVQLMMDRNINLSKEDEVKLLLNSPKADDAENIQNLTIRFSDINGTKSYEYPITNLKQGTNVVNIPVKQLVPILGTLEPKRATSSARRATVAPTQSDSTIINMNKVTIELTSRPNTYVELFFDRLWVLKTREFKNEFKASNENIVTLKQYNNKDYVYVWPIGGNTAFIKKLTNVNNYSFVTKIIPIKEGVFGIINRANFDDNHGYYLTFSGIASGEWQLYKLGKKSSNEVLDQGDIENYVIEKDQPIWIKMELDDSTIRAFFSVDGSSFNKLTEVRDNEIKRGGIGYYTNGGAYLVESFNFSQ